MAERSAKRFHRAQSFTQVRKLPLTLLSPHSYWFPRAPWAWCFIGHIITILFMVIIISITGYAITAG